ncbi:MAG: GNAT family N-acetyltransferase [Lewinellaceae bacterium]|nr:GNAT family N-acetyltransferase [Saprospiraceae bacterium]MCB9337292.1 GNAT family N-acetyltransferase [Lewinellaceae bacterium]
MIKQELYNPFTRLTLLEKLRLVQFLAENAENGQFSAHEVTEAVECAVKERPSFGGFILTLEEEHEMLGAIVVSCTGMETMNPRHRLMLLAIAKEHRHNGVAKKLVDKAIAQAGGDLSIQLEPGNGEVAFFEKLGFKARYVDMRWGDM